MGRGGQHAHATLEETIYTIGIDTVPQIAKLVVEKVRSHQQARELPDWLQLQLGTDDLPDAFRGCPLHSSQQCAAVVAIWSPSEGGVEVWHHERMPLRIGISGGNLQPVPHPNHGHAKAHVRTTGSGILRR